MLTGWTSPSIAEMMRPNSPLIIDKNEAAWIASLLVVGRTVGILITTQIIRYFGSKKILLWVGIIDALGLICLAVANSVLWIYISRTICGISMGMFLMSFPLFVGEISNRKIRGALICIISSGISLGFLLGSIIAANMTITSFSLISLLICIIFVGSFFWQPESPHYLIETGKIIEATKAIEYYQRDADVLNELKSLQQFVNDKKIVSYCDMLKELMIIHNRLALIKLNVFYLLSAIGGANAIVSYLEILLTEAKVTIIEPANAVIIATAIGLIGEVIAVITGDKLGRKFLLCTSTLGIAVALGALGLNDGLLDRGYDPANFQWLPITSVVVFAVFINLGLISVPSVILSELFSPNVKIISSSITHVLTGFMAFLSIQTYQPLIDHIGYSVYYFYSLIMIIATLFVVFFIPETKGKSLQEIQEMLKN